MATAPSFIIQELTGDKRVLTLRGRSLPYRGLKFVGKQRVVITNPPGSTRGTPTVLGPEFGPTTVEGEWKDVFLGRTVSATGSGELPVDISGRPIAAVQVLARVVDSIRLAGQLLRVTWAGNVRRGFMTEFTPDWQNVHDAKWSMTFEWVSYDDDEAPMMKLPSVDVTGISRRMSRAYTDFLDVPAPGSGIGFRFTTGLNKLRGQLENAIFSIEDATQNFVKAVTQPLREVGNLVATCESVSTESSAMMDYLSTTWTDIVDTKGTAYQIPAPEGDAVSGFQSLTVTEWQYDQKAQLRTLRSTSLATQNDIAAASPQVVVDTYQARNGDTLQSVSFKYYGDDSHWRDLMVYNDLPSSVLIAGDLVEIPRQTRRA
jgi:hypothetical protein